MPIQKRAKINSPVGGSAVRGLFYPGGEFLPRQAYEAISPSGGNTFVPSGSGWQASGGQGRRNPDMIGERDVPSSGQNYEREDERIEGTNGRGIGFKGEEKSPVGKTPRTVTVNHPGRNLSKVELVDPLEAYAARYGSFFYNKMM